MSAILFCLFGSTQTLASQLDRSNLKLEPARFNALASYALVETLHSGTKVGTGPVCAHRFFSSVAIHRFVILQSSCFKKMASDREKWSNYVNSCISGTHGVDFATPFWTGTMALIPGQCQQLLRNETERSHITLNGTNFA